MQVASQPAMECLPLVMEPQSGFYTDPVVVLDFQSLYPSMIIAYNLCYSTCLGTVFSSKASVLGVTSYFPDPLLLKDLKQQILLTPNGIMYVPSKVWRFFLLAFVHLASIYIKYIASYINASGIMHVPLKVQCYPVISSCLHVFQVSYFIQIDFWWNSFSLIFCLCWTVSSVYGCVKGRNIRHKKSIIQFILSFAKTDYVEIMLQDQYILDNRWWEHQKARISKDLLFRFDLIWLDLAEILSC